jgi:hypothetical protein
MSMRRGLFRVWVVASLGWIAFAAWSDDVLCFVGFTYAGTRPWCADEFVYPLTATAETVAWIIGIPMALLLIGYAAGWTIRGFC